MYFLQKNLSLCLAAFFLVFGLTLLFFFGPVELSCNRVNPDQVHCSLVRSTAFGFLKQDDISLAPLKAARLDTKIQRQISGENGQTYESAQPVYNVVLVSDREVLWSGGYSDNLQQNQAIVDRINIFLADVNQNQLSLIDRNYTLEALTVLMFGVSGIIFFKII